jgi:hypothetical protein
LLLAFVSAAAQEPVNSDNHAQDLHEQTDKVFSKWDSTLL